jgi:glycosyltransferase involved in cell wall biosynthesis
MRNAHWKLVTEDGQRHNTRMRLAWFSPLPPVPSGIAACSAEILGELSKRHEIDVFVHVNDPRQPLPTLVPRESLHIYSAHDFVWRHRAQAYDLTIYQIGNSSHHDYIWPYLFRYPGLTVLHDVHVHHARAAALLRTRRPDHFRTEFAANHPHVSADLAELAVAGFDNHLYYAWPMCRLILEASRLTAVHSPPMAAQLREEFRDAHITTIRLAHGERLSDDRIARARARVRSSYGIADEAVLFGVFGGLTPDKRIPQILDALAALIPYAPSAHLLLAGASARHYDPFADVQQRGLGDRVTVTGYLATDSELTDCMAACDVSLNLRWPTAREMSGPWLRALAAGRPTVTIDLAHLVDVPSIDPRTWRVNSIAAGYSLLAPGSNQTRSEQRTASHDSEIREPVTIAIDILDEDHSLRLAMRRLATDPALRASLGAAGQRYWDREHSMPQMVDDYERALMEAAARPAPSVTLPEHLVSNGERVLNEVLSEFGLGPVWT